MFAIVQNNTIVQLVREGTAFTLDGVDYPFTWCNTSTPEEKAAIGMVDVIYGPRPDDRYYWVVENTPTISGDQVVGTFTATPKDLDQTKAQCKAQINNAAYVTLLPNDWMVVKSVETSTPVPTDWATWRQSVRTAAAGYVTSIMAAADMPALEAVMATVTWPNNPDYVAPVDSPDSAQP
jgi:hypothetical protein